MEANWPKKATASSAHSKELHEWCAKLTRLVANLSERVVVLENDKKKSNQTIVELTKKLDKQQNISYLTYSDLVKDKKQNKTSENQLVMVAKISNELNQKKKIENNFIISGIVESTGTDKNEKQMQDKAKIIELLQTVDENLNGQNVKRLIRLPRKNKKNTQTQRPEL